MEICVEGVLTRCVIVIKTAFYDFLIVPSQLYNIKLSYNIRGIKITTGFSRSDSNLIKNVLDVPVVCPNLAPVFKITKQLRL